MKYEFALNCKVCNHLIFEREGFYLDLCGPCNQKIAEEERQKQLAQYKLNEAEESVDAAWERFIP